MSQQKVEYKKIQKRDRKKILKKRRMERIAITTATACVSIAILGWVGYSIYDKAQEADAENVTYTAVDLSSVGDYLSGIDTGEAAE